ncbi:MAG: DUF3137 domain-containing protein [Planctomycetota bacterium]|jgi:hypothetical protein
MKTLEELENFYKTNLLPELLELEERRKKLLKKYFTIVFVVLSIAAALVLVLITSFNLSIDIIFVFIILCAGILTFICVYIMKGYVRNFKILIIDQIVHFIGENLTYYQSRYIPKSVFIDSQIFRTKPNRYKGDDYVTGRIGETKIDFSEIDAKYESGSGKNRRVKTVFKGLFFIADFNKNFNGQTIVLPDAAEKLFGLFGKLLQSWNLVRDQLIKLEDPEFEKLFVVYGSDQVEARYILSTSLMRRIIDFREKTNRNIYLSFVGSKVFVAVPYTKNLFEPRIFKTVVDFEPIKEYYEDLLLAVGIVDDLNLNTRIWSKN